MNKNFSNEDLLNPNEYQDTYKIPPFSKEVCESLFRKLVLIRETEIKIANERKLNNIKGPVHLSAGQEAISVGISENVNKSDYIFGNHRSHAHILSLGSPVEKLFAELIGRSTGLSKGYGGSMHLLDMDVGFMGSVPIVAGTVSMAVGAGFAISQSKSESISIAYLGDGAVEEGVFHESLNLAKVNNLPVLFVVENNLFSSHMDIHKRQPSSFTSRFASSNLIEYKIVDGNNVLDVLRCSKELIKNIRETKEPKFIEAITYRTFGHVDWREDVDVGTNRCADSLEKWKLRCPIKRFKSSLIEHNFFSELELDNINLEIINALDYAWQKATNDPLVDKKSLLRNVFFEKK